MMASGSSSADWPPPRTFTDEQLQDLRDKIRLLSKEALSMGLDRQGIVNTKAKVMRQIKLVETTYKERQITAASAIHDCLTPSMNEDEACKEEEPRYLCILNGCAICLLDLKQSSANPMRNIAPLPRNATLDLIKEQLPVLAGLFKLGSHAYMIGGQELPAKMSVDPNCDNPASCDLYAYFFYKHQLNGTSRVWYRLSIADNDKDNDNCTLSACECNIIGNMKRPKIWPIVEEIDGEIHLFDSSYNTSRHPSSDWVFSHEVLRREHDVGWRWDEIDTSGGPVVDLIESHLVIGQCIYATSEYGENHLLFDSRKRKWEACEPSQRAGRMDKCNMKHVWDIMSHGNHARCVLDYEVGGNHDHDHDRNLYVVIAFRDNYNANPQEGSLHYDPDLDYTTTATAYLVNSTGEVLCTQFLPHFFDSTMLENEPEETVLPLGLEESRIVKADNEGKTMCALVKAVGEKLSRSGTFSQRDECLFVVRFGVEMLPGAASRYGTGKGPRLGEFVRVDIKDSSIYNVSSRDYEDGVLGHCHGLQACFL